MGESNFGTNLKALIKTRGMSQKALAEAIDVTNQTLTNWVNGKSIPKSQPLIEKLCIALNATQRELFGYSDGYATASTTTPTKSPTTSSQVPAALIEAVSTLNEVGQAKVISYAHDLAAISEYRAHD